MADFMNKLLDKIGDREMHPLMGLLDIVTVFVRDYEMRNVEIPDAEPSAVLRLLMVQHDLRQTDLAKIFGPQSNVGEVLSGKREINARQARALGNNSASLQPCSFDDCALLMPARACPVGGLPYARVAEVIELFATQVAPVLRRT